MWWWPSYLSPCSSTSRGMKIQRFVQSKNHMHLENSNINPSFTATFLRVANRWICHHYQKVYPVEKLKYVLHNLIWVVDSNWRPSFDRRGLFIRLNRFPFIYVRLAPIDRAKHSAWLELCPRRISRSAYAVTFNVPDLRFPIWGRTFTHIAKVRRTGVRTLVLLFGTFTTHCMSARLHT